MVIKRKKFKKKIPDFALTISNTPFCLIEWTQKVTNKKDKVHQLILIFGHHSITLVRKLRIKKEALAVSTAT